MNIIIVFHSLPLGAGGPECVEHLDHSRGAWSDLITPLGAGGPECVGQWERMKYNKYIHRNINEPLIEILF